MAAAARIHRGYDLDPGRIGHMGIGARDRDAPAFHRLTQRFERCALKLRY
jgi:hypothetical protein